MKRKHYPILTILGAVLLTSLPLALFLAFTGQQNPEDQLADLTSPVPETAAGAVNFATQRGEISEVAELKTEQAFPAKSAERPAPDTRHHASAQPLLAEASQLITTPPAKPAGESHDVTARSNGTTASSINVDLIPVLTPVPVAPRSIVEPSLDFTEAMAAITNVPGSMDSKPNHYQATGHLALLAPSTDTEPIVRVPNAEHPMSAEQVPSATNDMVAETGRPSRGPRSKADRQDPSHTSSESSTGNPRKTRDTVAADADKQALIENVLIQTPVENSSVSRVENLVASTRARGWPIALVRSDLPDDVWWVQQVVGIQGNSFAARVNFGNEYSLSGSVYRMVIVFLDTPDEVRRFRIAKQFKEIPEGTRRSREFHYIRN